jgi:O-methyltransferase
MTSLTAFTRDARKLAAGWRWRLGYMLGTPVPSHYEDELARTIKRVRRDTLTSAARIAALCDSVEYLVRSRIEGDLAECGVWRGGSMMAAALTLIRLGDTERDLYLFDTYTGMTEPSDADVSSPYDGYSLHRRWRRRNKAGQEWAGVPASEVRARVERTGYQPEDTLPAHAPDSIALLRLDTDWYESTKHELVELYPNLCEGGVLIVDDYGHYEGARRAVDEYFAETGQRVLLSRIDYTGRVAIKQPLPVAARA